MSRRSRCAMCSAAGKAESSWYWYHAFACKNEEKEKGGSIQLDMQSVREILFRNIVRGPVGLPDGAFMTVGSA